MKNFDIDLLENLIYMRVYLRFFSFFVRIGCRIGGSWRRWYSFWRGKGGVDY